jgi:hypothetical protein
MKSPAGGLVIFGGVLVMTLSWLPEGKGEVESGRKGDGKEVQSSDEFSEVEVPRRVVTPTALDVTGRPSEAN